MREKETAAPNDARVRVVGREPDLLVEIALIVLEQRVASVAGRRKGIGQLAEVRPGRTQVLGVVGRSLLAAIVKGRVGEQRRYTQVPLELDGAQGKRIRTGI